MAKATTDRFTLRPLQLRKNLHSDFYMLAYPFVSTVCKIHSLRHLLFGCHFRTHETFHILHSLCPTTTENTAMTATPFTMRFSHASAPQVIRKALHGLAGAAAFRKMSRTPIASICATSVLVSFVQICRCCTTWPSAGCGFILPTVLHGRCQLGQASPRGTGPKPFKLLLALTASTYPQLLFSRNSPCTRGILLLVSRAPQLVLPLAASLPHCTGTVSRSRCCSHFLFTPCRIVSSAHRAASGGLASHDAGRGLQGGLLPPPGAHPHADLQSGVCGLRLQDRRDCRPAR